MGNSRRRNRKRWILKCTQHTSKTFRSPLHATSKFTLEGNEVDFSYERNIKTPQINEKIYREVAGVEGFNLLFSSGMMSIFQAINFIKKVYKNKKAKGFVSAGYYETVLSKGVLHDIGVDWDLKTKENYDPNEVNVDEYDFFVFEPVRATFNLDPTNIKLFLKKLSTNKKYPKVVIIDSSFIGNTFEMEEIISMAKKSNLIIFNIRSGIKHDQLGMEFCNVGYLDAYFLNEAAVLKDYTYTHLLNGRDFIGGNISYTEYCLIDNPFTFSSKDTHAELVLDSTYIFFKELKKD